MSTMDREFDIIVYGASGFTARYIIKDLMNTNFKIALSGRSAERIKLNVGFSPVSSSLPILTSTIDNLAEVSRRGRVLLNCAGPYIHCGEEVVKACISTKTHYVDITGESIFVDKMIEKYHEEAEEKEVLVIPCCGYDSVPADIGVMYLKQIMGCRPVWSRSYMHMHNSYANRTSYETLVHNLGRIGEMNLGKESGKGKKGENPVGGGDSGVFEKDKLKKKPFFNPVTQTYCTVFLGSDAPTVRRSQKLLSERGLCEAVQYGAYYSVGNFLALSFFLCWVSAFYLVSRLEAGRRLLIRYPGFFTFGRVKEGGPSEEMMAASRFRMVFEGLGVTDEGRKHRFTARVSGPDPGYVTTPLCASVCAAMLVDMVRGDWKSAFQGGVLTPAAVFHGTDIIDRLKRKGIKFEEISRVAV